MEFEPPILKDLFLIFKSLSPKRQKQLFVLLLMMILSALGEVIGLSTIIPFLGALSDADSLFANPKIGHFTTVFSIRSPRELAVVLAYIFVFSIFISNCLQVFTAYIQSKLSAYISSDISIDIYRKIIHQPYPFHTKKNSSIFINGIAHDVGTLTVAILPHCMSFVVNITLSIAVILTLFIIQAKVTFVLLAITASIYFIFYKITKIKLKKHSNVRHSSSINLIKTVQESLGGIRDVLLDRTQAVFVKIYQANDMIHRRALSSAIFLGQVPRYVIETTAVIIIAATAVHLLEPHRTLSGAIPVLGAFTLGANRLLPALQRCYLSITTLRATRSSLNFVVDAISLPFQELSFSENSTHFDTPLEIEFKKVWFRYSESSPWVLEDVSFTINANSVIGIVGTTGSGKSTVADLVLGLLKPSLGEIYIGGKLFTDLERQIWQKNVAHVPQNIFLTDTSIMENIAFGVPREAIDLEKVRKSAKMANIDEFIGSRTMGYEEVIGERGIRLSGGQRQRIGIARALYKDPTLIVFDEATNALDSATEREIMKAIGSLIHKKIIILITHRLTTVEGFDRILEFNEGRLVAMGTFHELLEQSNTFKLMAEKNIHKPV